MNIFEKISDRFSKVTPLPEGTHHLQATQDEKPYRLHLRLRADGSGLLILNASTVLQLNPTAAEYAYHFIKGTTPKKPRNKFPNAIEWIRKLRWQILPTSQIRFTP